jgi:hypothetical protein
MHVLTNINLVMHINTKVSITVSKHRNKQLMRH